MGQDLLLHRVQLGQQLAGLRDDEFSQSRRARTTPVPHEEGAAQHAFDALQLGRQGRLGHPEPGSRPGQAPGVRHGPYDSEVAHFEVHHTMLCPGGMAGSGRQRAS